MERTRTPTQAAALSGTVTWSDGRMGNGSPSFSRLDRIGCQRLCREQWVVRSGPPEKQTGGPRSVHWCERGLCFGESKEGINHYRVFFLFCFLLSVFHLLHLNSLPFAEAQKEVKENLHKVKKIPLLERFPLTFCFGDILLDCLSLLICWKWSPGHKDRTNPPSRDTDSNKNMTGLLIPSLLYTKREKKIFYLYIYTLMMRKCRNGLWERVRTVHACIDNVTRCSLWVSWAACSFLIMSCHLQDREWRAMKWEA